MEQIYCLTCNRVPVIASSDINKLKDKQKFLLELIADDEDITVIDRNESKITYHTGISYVTDEFEIVQLELL